MADEVQCAALALKVCDTLVGVPSNDALAALGLAVTLLMREMPMQLRMQIARDFGTKLCDLVADMP